jgi:hypothetical protein
MCDGGVLDNNQITIDGCRDDHIQLALLFERRKLERRQQIVRIKE